MNRTGSMDNFDMQIQPKGSHFLDSLRNKAKSVHDKAVASGVKFARKAMLEAAAKGASKVTVTLNKLYLSDIVGHFTKLGIKTDDVSDETVVFSWV